MEYNTERMRRVYMGNSKLPGFNISKENKLNNSNSNKRPRMPSANILKSRPVSGKTGKSGLSISGVTSEMLPKLLDSYFEDVNKMGILEDSSNNQNGNNSTNFGNISNSTNAKIKKTTHFSNIGIGSNNINSLSTNEEKLMPRIKLHYNRHGYEEKKEKKVNSHSNSNSNFNGNYKIDGK